jgi:hypothetical protein
MFVISDRRLNHRYPRLQRAEQTVPQASGGWRDPPRFLPGSSVNSLSPRERVRVRGKIKITSCFRIPSSTS